MPPGLTASDTPVSLPPDPYNRGMRRVYRTVMIGAMRNPRITPGGFSDMKHMPTSLDHKRAEARDLYARTRDIREAAEKILARVEEGL